MQFKYKANALFAPGPITRLNACIGVNGGPYDFRDYAFGYFLAARKLLQDLREDSAYVDTLVYPLAFLFRHAIELSLKGLARGLYRLNGETGELRLTHKLIDNWSLVKCLMSRHRGAFDADGTAFVAVDRILKDYLEFDPVGEVFRFPEDRDGILFLQEARLINVVVLGSALEEIANLFDFWFRRIDTLLEVMLENQSPSGEFGRKSTS